MKKGQYQSPDSTRPSLGGKDGFDALFEHARRDAFTPEETERLWQNVMAAGPGGGGDAGPEIPGGAARGWTSATTLKAAAGLALVGGIVAAVFVAGRSGSTEPVVVPSGAAQTAQATEVPRGEGSPPVVSWEDLPRVHGPAQSEAKPAAPAVPRGRNPAAPPEPPPATEVSSAVSAPAAPSEPGPAAPMAVPAPASPSEGALLLRARQQLVTDPASALELTDEAGRRFPEGALVPEREVLAIEALTRLGRLPSARARFAAFRARYPQSPHLARLQSLLSQ